MSDDRIYGFKWKELPWGERVPDCAWLVRAFMHFYWTLLFHAVPTDWQLGRSGNLRNKIGETVIMRFAWWYASHRKYRGYAASDFERSENANP